MKLICHICHKIIKEKSFRIDKIEYINGNVDFQKAHVNCKG